MLKGFILVSVVLSDKVFLFFGVFPFLVLFFFCNDDVVFTVFLNVDGEDNGEPNNGDFGEGVLSIIYYT